MIYRQPYNHKDPDKVIGNPETVESLRTIRRRDSAALGRRVLLVQLRGLELNTMEEMLRVLGYQVTKTTESVKALMYFNKVHHNVVVSELDLPRFSGFSLAVRIKQLSSDTPVLLTTARCQAEVVHCMDHRLVDGWLFKPFRLSELQGMVTRVTRPLGINETPMLQKKTANP